MTEAGFLHQVLHISISCGQSRAGAFVCCSAICTYADNAAKSARRIWREERVRATPFFLWNRKVQDILENPRDEKTGAKENKIPAGQAPSFGSQLGL